MPSSRRFFAGELLQRLALEPEAFNVRIFELPDTGQHAVADAEDGFSAVEAAALHEQHARPWTLLIVPDYRLSNQVSVVVATDDLEHRDGR